MPHPRPAALLTSLLLAAAACAPASADPHAAAKAIYAASCARCHGSDLRGGGASSLADGVWVHGSGGQIARNIRTGIAEAGMPAFGDALDNKQIKGLIAYMRDVEKEVAPTQVPLPSTIPTRDYDLKVSPFATGLATPWAITFTDPDTALITERPGRLRVVRNGVLDPAPIAGIPEIAAVGQGGLLDVVADPDHATNGWIYLSYSHADPRAPDASPPAAMTRVVRGRIRDHAWTDQEIIFEADPVHYIKGGAHFGSRIAFDAEDRLYFSIGDRGQSNMAQDRSRPNGKIHRVNPDGTVPDDNPFVSDPDAYPSIYSFGHRNPQGLVAHPRTGRIWETEHGPNGGDEVNLISPGLNYGWPVISYGINYSGTVFVEKTRATGMEQPVMYWKPSIAACGLTSYGGDQFPRWKNNLFAGGLSYEVVERLVIEGDRVMYREPIIKGLGRVRDVQEGPGGALYVVLNSPDTVIKLTRGATHPGPGDGNDASP